MAVSYTEHSPSFSLNASLQSAVEKLKLQRARRVAYLSTYRELATMTDVELAQMKIGRPMIAQLARQAAERV